jgi:hypothetical protein
MKNRVYVQSEFFLDLKLVEVEDGATIEELKQACMALFPPQSGEIEIHLFAEDDDEYYESHHKVEHLKKPHGIRVHLHRCKHIAVTVRFAGNSVSHEFRPATTIGRIREWAGDRLGMQSNDIAEHVLQIVVNSEQPEVDVHIGSLAKYPACSVEFDLVPAHRING